MKYIHVVLFLLIPCLAISEIQIVNQTESSVTIDFRIEDLTKQTVKIDNEEYVLYNFRNGLTEQLVGKPVIPHFETRLAIPQGAKLNHKVSIIESETHSQVDVVPLNQLYIRGKLQQTPKDETVYGQVFPFPEKIVEISEPYNFRNIPVVRLRINPIRYFPMDHRVEMTKKIRVIVNFSGKRSTIAQKFNKKESDILSHKILNFEQANRFAISDRKSFGKLSVDYDFSTGEWYRFPIQETGPYQLTGAFLKDKGVDIDAIQLSGVHLYNHGGFQLPYSVREDRPQDLNEIAVQVVDNNQDGFMDTDDKIIFYGRALGGWSFNSNNWEYQNYLYDDTNYYLFTFNNQPGKRIESIQSPQVTNPQVPQNFEDFYHFEVDKYNILSSGSDWYWLKLTGLQDKKSAEFQLPQNIENDPVDYTFRFKGGSGSLYGDNANYQYRLRAVLNGEVLFNDFTLYRSNRGTRDASFEQLFGAKSGDNELTIHHTGNLDGCEVYLDYFEIYLKRPFVAENDFLHFRKLLNENEPVEFQITNLPNGQNVVWDLTNFNNIKQVQPIQNGQTVVFQDESQQKKAGEYLVFSSEIIRSVENLEAIENHPNLRNPARKAEFLILTPDEFYDEATFLEDWRETQVHNRLETERVRMSEIFLEFSSSVRDVTAIRDFLKYAYNNWSDTLQYVLLFGDGHYDYRNLELKDIPNQIPPFEIYNQGEVDSRETDNFYVALGNTGNLNDLDPWLPIGRLPFNSIDQIESYREKGAKYSESYKINSDMNGWQTWVTLVSDDEFGGAGSNNELSWHLDPTEDVNKHYISRKFNRTKIYLHDYEQIPGGLGRWKPKATEDLVNQINRGSLLINYFGHGDPDTWAHESVLNRTRDLPKLHNEFRLPLWVAATCTWGKYDDPDRTCMSEELLWRQQRGGIAVISAARPVFVFGNVQFAKNFYRYLFHNSSEKQPSRLLGDAYFLAMENHGSRNYQKYHLFGDPTLELADPEYLVDVQSITPDTLKALSTVTVEAQITDQNGNFLSDFNGYAVLNVSDAVDSLYTESINLWYKYRGGTVFKGLVSVENGKISGRFIVPKSIKYKKSPTGRISIYAWSQNRGDAIGYADTLLFTGTESQVTDQSGPEINVAFKEIPNFFDGDFVGNQPTLNVEISDESGINLTGEVGHRIDLTIDDGLKKDVTDFFVYETDSYQSGKLEYTLPVLSSGTHQLKISCWDNLNNYSERLVAFRATEDSELKIVNAVNYPNPFSSDTEFMFQLNKPSNGADVTISVYTVTGRKIQEIREIIPAGESFVSVYWNGLDWDGDIIANGVYLYKIVVDNGEESVEKIDKLAVVR